MKRLPDHLCDDMATAAGETVRCDYDVESKKQGVAPGVALVAVLDRAGLLDVARLPTLLELFRGRLADSSPVIQAARELMLAAS